MYADSRSSENGFRFRLLSARDLNGPALVER